MSHTVEDTRPEHRALFCMTQKLHTGPLMPLTSLQLTSGHFDPLTFVQTSHPILLRIFFLLLPLSLAYLQASRRPPESSSTHTGPQ